MVAPAIDYDSDVRESKPSAIDVESADLLGQDRGFEMRRRDTDQPSLFPTDDLVIPDALRSMRKAISAIHAVPVKADHSQSLNSRRLFDAFILLAQIDCKRRGRDFIARIKTERVSPLFEVRITEIARLAKIPGKNYTRIYEEMDKLFEMVLRWNIVGEEGNLEWEMKSHFLSSLGYGKGHKRGLIRFSIDPSILEIVLEPRHWATLSLQAMEGLGTAASYALYQQCWRYVNTHAKVTAALPTATWIELLIGPSRYVVDDPVHGKRVREYGDFKRRTLVDAVRRVNKSSALGYELELKELFSGTRVSRIQFKFIPKKSLGLGLPLTWPSEVLDVLAKIGYSEIEIENMSQAHSHEEVADSIMKLKDAEARMRATGQRTITSKKAYFGGILANVAAGASLDNLDHEQIESESARIEAQKAAEDRKERLTREFLRHQSDRFTVSLFKMDAPSREALFDAFERSPEGVKAKLLVAKGWEPSNVGALSIFRVWLSKSNPELFESLLPNPEDRSIDAWMAWRLDNAQMSAQTIPGN